ncbi:hypothetical protein ACE193_25225 [Bernardetia sp. OM2101]|uniref:hypothetical protein n=1 Tax=Bernardetia sp. OM2101 TaxID=3344876 RepID=UPI0035D12F78
MKNEFIYQDKENFKNELITPILAESSKYQAFATKIAEQEKKWNGVEIDIKNCKEIIEEKKKFDAMKLEEEVYKDSVFFFLDTLNRVLTYVQENNFGSSDFLAII